MAIQGQWRTEGGGVVGSTPPQKKIPKALQNRAKLNTIWKLLKIAEFRPTTPQDVGNKAGKL